MTAEEYFGDWLKVIDEAELNKVLNILTLEYKNKNICPTQKDIFKAFNLCTLNDLKIVMLGQDPYPQKGVATGVLFGNNNTPISPSLEVIKDSVIDYTIPHNRIEFDDSLESWAKQGILMLNSALTVEMNKVGSHTMLWRPFISKLLKNLSEYNTAIIYVLFGRQAQTFSPYINKRFNHIIEIEHPAYFARTKTRMPNIFIDINKKVKNIYGTTINWYKEY